MRILAISCEVLARLLYASAATSPHVIDIRLVDKGLHTKPQELQRYLQGLLNEIDPNSYDAIVLGYGLCSNATVGLTAPIKMVIPRAHDCITLFLGNREKYAAEFREHPGTYWYEPDYMERNSANGDSLGLGSDNDQSVKEQYAEYVTKYGQDNADYLMQVMGAWKSHYDRAAFIRVEDVPLPDYTPQVRTIARDRGWNYAEITGHSELIRCLLHGEWDNGAFLTLEPGESLEPSYDASIMRCPFKQGESHV